MECRPHCAACCIAPSIIAPLPNMPDGKPAGIPCANLDSVTLRCTIWQQENYPKLCARFQAEESVCGNSRDEALEIIRILEEDTRPK